MQGSSAFDELMKDNRQYSSHAYEFVLDTLTYVVDRNAERRHITGRELLSGVREFALDSWGLMARHVLNSWGIKSTDDIGEIVFLLVNAGILSKTDQDKKEDFQHVFPFTEAFDDSHKPELDENGHVRRKHLTTPPQERPDWPALFGDTGLN